MAPRWRPADRPPTWEPDTLFLLDPRDEMQVLAEGGRMAEAYGDYFGDVARAALVPGPYSRLGVAQPGGRGGPALIYTVDGLLPVDEFTVSFRVRRAGGADAGADTSASAASVELLRFGRHLVVDANAVEVRASWVGSTVALPMVLDDAWQTVSITWDGETLTLLSGSGEHTASTAAPAAVEPVSGVDDGLRILGGTDQAHPFQLAELHVSRHARTPSSVRVHHGPAMFVDASARLGRSFPEYACGAVGLYTGFRVMQDGVGPDIGTAIRDAQFRACADAGMPLMRLGGVVSSIKVTEDGYDFSIIHDKLDLLHERGVAFHITLDYNHPITGAVEYSKIADPPDDYGRYAELCSHVVAHLRERYRVVSVALWNEPEFKAYFNGTAEQFHELWRTVQRRFMADHPDLLLMAGDWAYAENTIAQLEDIAAHGLPVAGATVHTYQQDLAIVRDQITAVRAAADRLGFDGLPIRITEWAMQITLNQERYSNGQSVVNAWPNRFRNAHSAAFAVAFVHDVLDFDEGIDMTTFSCVGAVDHGFLSERGYTICDEAMLSSEDPPRPFPSFAAMSLLWRLRGERVRADVNWPSLRAIATSDGATTMVVYASYRPWRPADRVHAALVWEGLPERFRWRQWQMDDALSADGRLLLVGEGDERDLPLGVDLGVIGVGGIEVYSEA